MAEYYTTTIKTKGRITKGHFGYIRQQKKRLLIRTLILALGVAGLVIIGYVVTKTTKNLLSVAGILTAVPMAMQAASLIFYWKFKGRPEAEYEKVRQLVKNGVMDAELIVAKRDGKAIPVNYACFTENEVLVFTGDATLDIKEYTEYLHRFLRLSEVDCEIRLLNDIDKYLASLRSRKFTDRDEIDETVLKREGVFRAISM